MKQHTQPAKELIAPELKKLHTKFASAKQAAEKSLADYEQEAIAYQTTLQEATSKIAVLQGLAALRIARFSFKIKQTEYKLAKASLKMAKKELNKSAKKAAKAAAEVAPLKADDKSAKKIKKGAPAKG